MLAKVRKMQKIGHNKKIGSPMRKGGLLSLAALILAMCLEFLITLEWSYPYCTQPSDGPAYPVVGFPLPYAVASHVSSLEFFFMPHVVALNLLLISTALYPLIFFLNQFIAANSALKVLGLVAFFFLGIAALMIRGPSFSVGVPVWSIGDGPVIYGDLRPVGFTSFEVVHSKRKCRSSRFWFPDSNKKETD